jgi:hypothetical protein
MKIMKEKLSIISDWVGLKLDTKFCKNQSNFISLLSYLRKEITL